MNEAKAVPHLPEKNAMPLSEMLKAISSRLAYQRGSFLSKWMMRDLSV